MRTAIGAGAVGAVPIAWDFLGYRFEAGPLIVTVCAALMTRAIVSLQAAGKRRWILDGVVTALCMLVSALWVQDRSLGLLPAGITGIAAGAIGVGIIGIAKSQATVVLRSALQALLRGMPPAEPPKPDQDKDVLDRIDEADRNR